MRAGWFWVLLIGARLAFEPAVSSDVPAMWTVVLLPLTFVLYLPEAVLAVIAHRLVLAAFKQGALPGKTRAIGGYLLALLKQYIAALATLLVIIFLMFFVLAVFGVGPASAEGTQNDEDWFWLALILSSLGGFYLLTRFSMLLPAAAVGAAPTTLAQSWRVTRRAHLQLLVLLGLPVLAALACALLIDRWTTELAWLGQFAWLLTGLPLSMFGVVILSVSYIGLCSVDSRTVPAMSP